MTFFINVTHTYYTYFNNLIFVIIYKYEKNRKIISYNTNKVKIVAFEHRRLLGSTSVYLKKIINFYKYFETFYFYLFFLSVNLLYWTTTEVF